MKKVLLIEDDQYLYKVYNEGLAMAGFKPLGALTGEDGLRIAEREKPDIIILDLMLPGIQGEEVLRRLKENETTKDIPVVILSNIADMAESKSYIKNYGVAEYLLKMNVLMEDLVNIINKHTA